MSSKGFAPDCVDPFELVVERYGLIHQCAFCNEYKLITEFIVTSKARGYVSRCRTCYNEYKRANWKKWREPAQYKEYMQNWHRINRYGISTEDYQQMLKDQDHLCAICEGKFAELSIDHCHKSGVVRGLLCNPCNKGLGHFEDDPDRLLAAAKYVDWTHSLDIDERV